MKAVWRALIEVGFIIFLFYSNLLMGEFERSGGGRQKGLRWALSDVVTTRNLEIGIVASLIGYLLVEFLRARLWSDSSQYTTGLFSRSELEKGQGAARDRAGKSAPE